MFQFRMCLVVCVCVFSSNTAYFKSQAFVVANLPVWIMDLSILVV